MNWWIVRCVNCRPRTSQGVFGYNDEPLWCKSAEEAEARFRDLYECNAPVTVN